MFIGSLSYSHIILVPVEMDPEDVEAIAEQLGSQIEQEYRQQS